MATPTQIIDTWYLADGSLLNADCVATPVPTPLGIASEGSTSIAPPPVKFSVVNGAVNVSLMPNDSAQPLGTQYTIYAYTGRGNAFTDTWYVYTSATPLTLKQVRVVERGLPQVFNFATNSTWFLPASTFGTASGLIPIVLLFDASGNSVFGQVRRNMSTGDLIINFAQPQAGYAQLYFTSKQYSQAISAQTSVTIPASTTGLAMVAAAAVLDSSGNYIIGGFGVNVSLSGIFASVTFSFPVAQSGTVVILGA